MDVSLQRWSCDLLHRQSCIMNETGDMSLWSFYIHSKKHNLEKKKITMKTQKNGLVVQRVPRCVCECVCGCWLTDWPAVLGCIEHGELSWGSEAADRWMRICSREASLFVEGLCTYTLKHTQLRYTTRHLTSHHHLNPGVLWTPTPSDIWFVFLCLQLNVCRRDFVCFYSVFVLCLDGGQL